MATIVISSSSGLAAPSAFAMGSISFGHAAIDPPSDLTDPVVDNFSPANGSTIAGTDPIYFDVTDNSGQFTRVLVAVTQGSVTELAHDGDTFLAPYANLSTRTNILGGFRFKLRRDGGWQSAVTVTVYAIDLNANEA